MAALLICPGERSAVGFLAETGPLVVLPILGESLVSTWIGWLSNAGEKDILALVNDRPDAVRMAIDGGTRWGARVRVEAELTELTPESAAAKWASPDGSPHRPDQVVLLDHFPTLEKLPLFCSYRDWFKAVLAWMPYAARLNRVGLREIQPGVWCGLRSRVAASALLRAPCWLGNHVQVSADAVIGPNAILEDRVVVESASEVISSFVGSDTFVGALTRVEDSIAMGSTLIDWKSGSCTQVPDPFLLCALGKQSGDGRELGGRLGSWLGLFKRPMGVVSGWQERLRSK